MKLSFFLLVVTAPVACGGTTATSSAIDGGGQGTDAGPLLDSAVPVVDAGRDAEPAPTLDWLRVQVEFIDAERAAGRTVYVHCRNGALIRNDGLIRNSAV